MAAIHYLSELDKINAYKTYKPLIKDFTRTQLEIAILLILNGCDIEYAFDIAMGFKEE